MTASPTSAVDVVLRRALGSQSVQALTEALPSASFVLLLSGTSDPRVPLIATGQDGTRSLPTFSGPDSALAWGGDGRRVGVVDIRELLRLADHQQVDHILFDPAGPFPSQIHLAELQLLADGLVPAARGTALTVPFQVRAAHEPSQRLLVALSEIAADGPALWLFERRVAAGPVLTVGVEGTPELAGQVAARLGRLPDLPVLDVLHLEGAVLRAVHEQVPTGRVEG